MTQNIEVVTYKKNEIVCKEGEHSNELFFIEQGEVLVFVTQKSKIIPLAILKRGEFIGEMSFFDNKPRSANVMALKESEIHTISSHDIKKFFPSWLNTIAYKTTEKIRVLDHLIQEKGRKKQKDNPLTLTIEEEREIYLALQNAPLKFKR